MSSSDDAVVVDPPDWSDDFKSSTYVDRPDKLVVDYPFYSSSFVLTSDSELSIYWFNSSSFA